ncbi:MAG: T9SS type A sorting domain-containing protein [Bacteroidetes bacterium]|nr:T9SS type A sorting domain-containing protein [Bacteroidota bacterium]
MKIKPAYLLLLLIFSHPLFSQNTFFKSTNVPVSHFGTSISFPWTGGYDHPAFFNIDLNNDGILDLFSWDRNNQGHPGRITTFINNGTANTFDYEYAPEYAVYFPKVLDWCVLYDYNCDNKIDLLSNSSQGVRAYKNISQPGQHVAFQLDYPYIPADVTSNVFVLRTDHPALADFDNDGDMDIIAAYILGGFYVHYKNFGIEVLNRCDTLLYYTQANCFGNAYLSAFNNSALLNVGCKPQPPLIITQEMIDTLGERHAGGCPMAYDFDKNGMYDIFHGDVLASTNLMLYNGGTPGNDLFTWQDSVFPVYDSKPIDIYNFPGAYFIDIDNDGQRECIVACCDKVDTGENYNSVWMYENTPNGNVDSFHFVSDAFLVSETIDLGSGACPRFFDADADGLMDIIISNMGKFILSPDSQNFPQFAFYKNIGTATAPAFDLQTMDYAGMNQYGWRNIKHCFGDMDGDSDMDMLVGTTNGKFQYFENTAPQGNPASFVLTQNNYFGLDVGKNAAPYLYDFDNDGRLDIVAGNELGTLTYYQNSGTQTAPNFSSIAVNFGNVNVTPPFSIAGNAVPFVFNDSGTKLLVGNEYGVIYYYDNIDNNLNGNFALLDSTFQDIYEPVRACPDGADINGDTYPDLVVGNYAGGLGLYIQSSQGNNELPGDECFLEIFPNPATDYIACNVRSCNFNDGVTLQLYDIRGALVAQKNITSSYTYFNIDEFANGLYLLKLNTREGKQHGIKFQIMR